MLTTTIRPTSGSARVAGLDVTREPLAARLVSSVVFQDAAVDRSLTGRRNLEIHARLWRVDQPAASERIAELGGRLGLAELLDRPVGTYSGGQRRRLEIARALVSRPEILFLDEPTVGLDPRIRAELLDVIAGLRNRSETTILLTTHYLDEAQALADRVAIIKDGLIVADGPPSELSSRPGAYLVSYQQNGHRVELETEDPTELLHRLTGEAIDRGERLDGLTVTRPSLEDVYLELTAAEPEPAPEEPA
jgi:ABC-2 type transport system ATP-binding protein